MGNMKIKRKIIYYMQVYSLLLIPLAMFAVFYVYININNFVLAFQSLDNEGNRAFIGLANFQDFFNRLAHPELDPPLRGSIFNGIKLYFIGLIGHPICITIAYYVYKKGPLYKWFRFLVMLPNIITAFILSLVFKKFLENSLPTMMFNIFGIDNFPMLLSDARYTFPTVVFYAIWSSLATGILYMSNAMGAVDVSIVESSHLDGVNYFQELWYIIIPSIWGTISTNIITGVGGMLTASGPLVAFWMYSAPPETWTLGYYMTVRVMNVGDNQTGFPLLSAMGLLMTLFIIPIVYIVKWALNKIYPED